MKFFVKEGSERPKYVRTEESIKLVEEIILSQEDQSIKYSTLAEIVCELNIDCQSVSYIIDQDVDFPP